MPHAASRSSRYSVFGGSGLWLVVTILAVLGCPPNPGGSSGNDNGSNSNTNGGADGQVIFDQDYRSTYRLVRDCRNSIEHGFTVRVYVNEIGADAYLAQANPLPVGTIVVKEEFAGADCTDDSELVQWSAMKKEPPGIVTIVGNWVFQEVAAPDRRVTSASSNTCLRCHGAPGCIERDYMCTE